jgi:hypothetical protein
VAAEAVVLAARLAAVLVEVMLLAVEMWRALRDSRELLICVNSYRGDLIILVKIWSVGVWGLTVLPDQIQIFGKRFRTVIKS